MSEPNLLAAQFGVPPLSQTPIPQAQRQTANTPSAPNVATHQSAPESAEVGQGDHRRLARVTCCVCANSGTILTARQCSYCGGDEDPFYCISCTECETKFCADHKTCWDKHLSPEVRIAVKHHVIDPLPQLFVEAVTRRETDPEKQKFMHRRDEQARWLNIRRDHPSGPPNLHVYDRFIRLCDPTQSGNQKTKRHYPSFVSFIGGTAVGKSTLVRAMLLMGIIINSPQLSSSECDMADDLANEEPLAEFAATVEAKSQQGPVTRSRNLDHLTFPTTCGVHLYRDDGARRESSAANHLDSPPTETVAQYPILFTDCEGFGAGEAMTGAERMESDAHDLRGRVISGARSRSPSRRRDMALTFPVSERAYNSRGQDGVDLFYARFLYAISDVCVFVTKDDATILNELTKILEWAAKAVHKSINHPSRKTLILVRNMAEHHDAALYDNNKLKQLYLSPQHPRLWEQSDILRDFVRDYNGRPNHSFVDRITSNERLYKALFNNIVCCYIPDRGKVKGRPQELFAQYRKLRDLIGTSVQEGLQLRAESVMEYNVPALTHILNRAFEHFTTSESPFDFFLAARRDNPNPQMIRDHIANFLRHAFESTDNGEAIDAMVKDVVTLALLVFTYRTFSEAANPSEIFDREMYEVCNRALETYVAEYETCQYLLPDGQPCLSRPAKLHHFHTSKTQLVEPGVFVHARNWTWEEKKEWIRDIQQRFIESYEQIFIVRHDCDDEVTLEKRLCQRRELSHTNHHNIWKGITSNKTCLACLQAVPDHVLTCGHSYCPRCVQELGEVSQQFECAWNMQCWLCWEETGRNSHVIQLKPRCAGVRILSLDGGGIRGIVELAVLKALHDSVGLEPLPIKALFDLIVGTSTGGIIALALAMATKGSESLPEMMTFFETVSKQTFAQGALGKITQYSLMVLRLAESVFSSDNLRLGLQAYFHPKDTALFAPALHTHLMSSGTRVAVTSAKDMGQTACLISSYNHPVASPSSILEREEQAFKDMTIWEAAMATSAAPFYLPPFEKRETKTKYVDGAVYANCPAQVAFSEMEKLWPNGTASLDALVSLGTGMQKAKAAQDLPSLVNLGFFVTLRAMFQRQLDSKSSWANFKEHTCPASVRGRLYRFDAPIAAGGEEYVELYDHKKIPELKRRVEEWTKWGPAAAEIETVADTLVANLFFFEPDGNGHGQPAQGGLADKSNEVLQGSIRCRLGHQTPQLVHLLRNLVEGFAFTQLGAVVGDDDVAAVKRVPDTRWEVVRMVVRGREVAPGDMMVIDGGVPKFRVPVCVVVKKGSVSKAVLGVKLRRCGGRVAISGFPVTMEELKRRARECWLH